MWKGKVTQLSQYVECEAKRPSWGPQNLGWGVLGSGSGPQANTATSGPMFLHGWAPPASGACEWDPRKGLAGVSTPRVPGPSSTVQAPRMITVSVSMAPTVHTGCLCTWGSVCLSMCLTTVPKSTPCLHALQFRVQGNVPGDRAAVVTSW